MVNSVELSNLERIVVRLKEVRVAAGLTQREFAEMFEINHTTYCRYESGDIKKMPLNVVESICKKYGLNPAWLSGFEGVEKYVASEQTAIAVKRLPIIGQIAAGVPILAQEDLLGYEWVPENVNADFCLKVKGDSMINARILDGDLVYIRQQPDVENGEIAAVLVENSEATLKRVYKINGTVVLRAENPNIKDLVISRKDMKQVNILGKAIQFKSEVR